MRCCIWMKGGRFRCERGGGFDKLNFGEEPITPTSHSFHKARTYGRVAEGFTDLVNGFVQSVVEIDERVRGPKFPLNLLDL